MPKIFVNVDVPDLAAAEAFYTRAFGLRAGRRFDGFVELLGADAPIYLLEKAGGSAASAGGEAWRSYSRHWTPVHLDFLVTDVDAALARAEAAGARREGDVTTHVWGRLALLADPFGHGVCLVELGASGYDALPHR